MPAEVPVPPSSRTEPIGFVGLGAMGAPMARRLASLGYQVLVHDLDGAAVQSVVDCGARAAASAQAIASEARLVFTCLPSLEALRATLFGERGLDAGGALRTYVDFSTTGSGFARETAARLQERGIQMLAAPITGNVTTAGNGKLGIMCSGPQAAFRHAQPVMADLASAALLYLGEQTGKAQTLKLLNNLLSATGMASSCEAFILGVKGGLDPEVMLQVINAGEASSSASRNKFPQSILPRRFDFGARMAITAKDISLSVAEAEELGVPMWIGQTVRQVWKYAVSQGGADSDGTSLITFLEPWAGVEVRSRSQASPQLAALTLPAAADAECVLVCDAPTAAAAARRLQHAGWQVATAGEAARPATGAAGRCRLVALPPGSDATALLRALPTAGSGPRLVVNACLVSTLCAQAVARELADRGDAYLDALFTVPARTIESGGASVVAGGASTAFERAKPLLEALTVQVLHVSERPGDAQLLQQINGSLAATLLAASCESFVAGAKAGLDPLTMTKILGLETGRNAFSARIIPEQVATRRFDHGKHLGDASRELTLLTDEATRLGVTPFILDRARLLYRLATQLGDAKDDITRLITHYEHWAATEVKAATPAPFPTDA